MKSRTLGFLEYALAALLVLHAHASAQVPTFTPEMGGYMACVDGAPRIAVAPNIPPGSVAWVGLVIHESAHVVQVYRMGGCGPYERRMAMDDRSRDHAYRLQTEVEAYCAERAAGFFRGDGSLREIARILSGSPLYREWNWSEREAMDVLTRVCG